MQTICGGRSSEQQENKGHKMHVILNSIPKIRKAAGQTGQDGEIYSTA